MADYPGAAFGLPPEFASDHEQSQPYGVVYAPESLFRLLSGDSEEVFVGLQWDLFSASTDIMDVISTSAEKQILGHVWNDARNLLEHADTGDGRSAAYAARSLFEHLINFLDVQNSPELAQRYLDHQAITDAQISKAKIGLDLLPENERRKEEQRLETLGRKSRVKKESALKKYGAGFRRQWNNATLYERAEEHGLTSRYEHYRLLSSVLHGSSGGLIGAAKEIQGQPIQRMGAAYQLAVISLLEGLRSLGSVLKAIVDAGTQLRSTWAAQALEDSIAAAVRAWPEYRRVVLREDRKLWPETAPRVPRAVGVVAFRPPDWVRWYIHYPEMHVVVEADPPNAFPPGVEALLSNLKEHRQTAGGKPITTYVEGLVLRPKDGAKPINDRMFIQVRDE